MHIDLCVGSMIFWENYNILLYQGFQPGGNAFIRPSAAKGSNWGSESGSIPSFLA